MNTGASTDNIRSGPAGTVAHDQGSDARLFMDRIPRASIGRVMQTRLRGMYGGREPEWPKPQPARASKDWHVKPMEKM